ncbi:MAG: galactose/methyl galactoside ABC transporter ATP-binding protein MglA [Bacillota bacterium]|nr:galactose/methyl galactoside ABC transporter ATP-binding protein MglA [Bacillota bacterium]
MENKEKFLLEMKGITKSFPGVKALDEVDIKLRKGSVHALMGENGAGKSTLMKCLFGIYTRDEGQIILDGKEIKFTSANEALHNGVSMVHQELNQVLTTRVMDNIWLGRFPKKGLFVDEEKIYNETLKIFKDLDINIDPREDLNKLQVSEKQMVEIAKAVSYDSKVLVLDEPTSSLTEKEVNHLFRIIRNLKDKGVGVLYISHKMEELDQIADEVTILRDGKLIATRDINDITVEQIINLMVGRDLTHRFPEKKSILGDVILKVEKLTAKQQPSIKDISFELREGEILGIAGLVGSKRTDVLETIFGVRERKEGKIFLRGTEIDNSNPHKASNNGFALITEERRETGIFSDLSVEFNSIIANIYKYRKKNRILNNVKIKQDVDWVVESMSVKTPKTKTKIQSLSGGNQQKIIVGRWLLTNPEILLMDEPTRGIDVGAKYEIYQLMIELTTNGKGVIMVSSEMSELIGITDRIMVMSNGRLAGIVDTKTSTQEDILRLTNKYL